VNRTDELAEALKASEARLAEASLAVSEARHALRNSQLDDLGLRDHLVRYRGGRREWTGVVRSMGRWGNYVEGYKLKKDGTPGLSPFSEPTDRLEDLGPYPHPATTEERK
jgi:hypothetical protein